MLLVPTPDMIHSRKSHRACRSLTYAVLRLANTAIIPYPIYKSKDFPKKFPYLNTNEKGPSVTARYSL